MAELDDLRAEYARLEAELQATNDLMKMPPDVQAAADKAREIYQELETVTNMRRRRKLHAKADRYSQITIPWTQEAHARRGAEMQRIGSEMQRVQNRINQIVGAEQSVRKQQREQSARMIVEYMFSDDTEDLQAGYWKVDQVGQFFAIRHEGGPPVFETHISGLRRARLVGVDSGTHRYTVRWGDREGTVAADSYRREGYGYVFTGGGVDHTVVFGAGAVRQEP